MVSKLRYEHDFMSFHSDSLHVHRAFFSASNYGSNGLEEHTCSILRFLSLPHRLHIPSMLNLQLAQLL